MKSSLKANSRKLHVYSQGYDGTPAIILKGEWLRSAGFFPGDAISVSCDSGKLVITPREETEIERIRRKYSQAELDEICMALGYPPI